MQAVSGVFFTKIMAEKLLTPAEKDFLIRDFSTQNGIESAVLKAIIDVESLGSGFYPKDSPFEYKCKVRFEPDYFQKFSLSRPFFLPASVTVEAAKKDPKYTGRVAYEKALVQSPSSAIKATSFGIGQIMGFNYELVGYNSLTDFSIAMEESEYNQLEAMIKFIVNNKSLLVAAQQRDFEMIAKFYNGRDYKQRNYDVKLMQAYEAAVNNTSALNLA